MRIGCDKGTISRLESDATRYLSSPYSLIVNICRILGYLPERLFPVARAKRARYNGRDVRPPSAEASS